MRIENVYMQVKKQNIRGFLSVENDTIIFTQSAKEYDDGSTRSPYKKTFAERLFNRGAKKVVETVKAEKELFSLKKSKMTNITITPVAPRKIAGSMTYSSMVMFSSDGSNYMLSYSDYSEENVAKFEAIFK